MISYNKVIRYVSRIKHQIISQTKHNVIFYKLNVHIIKYIKKYWIYWIYFCLKSKVDCKIKKYNIFFFIIHSLFYYVCRELIIISTWITFIIEFLIFLIAEAPFWKNMRNIGPIWLPRRRIEFPYSYLSNNLVFKKVCIVIHEWMKGSCNSSMEILENIVKWERIHTLYYLTYWFIFL